VAKVKGQPKIPTQRLPKGTNRLRAKEQTGSAHHHYPLHHLTTPLRFPKPYLGRRKQVYTTTSATILILVIGMLIGLFVLQSVEVTQARVVSPPRIPVASGSGNPMAPPLGGSYRSGYNPLDDYQNPLAPKVKGEIGPALNRGMNQARDQHLPMRAQTGLQEMTERLVKSADSLFGPDPRTYKSPFVTGGEDNGRDWSNGTRYGPSTLPGVPGAGSKNMSADPNRPLEADKRGGGGRFGGVTDPLTGRELALGVVDRQGILKFEINTECGLDPQAPAIPQEQRVKGRRVFNELYNTLGGSDRIKGIRGSWYGTNLKMMTNFNAYQQGIASGKTPEQAALDTPTGRWAREKGYTKVEFIKISSSQVEVQFLKP
jgi:hypothetical protein